MNTEMVPLMTTCSMGRRILPEEIQRIIDQICPLPGTPRTSAWVLTSWPHNQFSFFICHSPYTTFSLLLLYMISTFTAGKGKLGRIEYQCVLVINTNMLGTPLPSPRPGLRVLYISHITLTTTLSWGCDYPILQMRK